MKRVLAVAAGALLAASAVVATGGTANAENPSCPNGSGQRAYKDSPDGYTGAIVCFRADGDDFYYTDSHADGLSGGMWYRATDGLAHDHDRIKLWDNNGALNGWEHLGTNEVEGTAVYYKACLYDFSVNRDYGCSAERGAVA
jgi:hypothetical protein